MAEFPKDRLGRPQILVRPDPIRMAHPGRGEQSSWRFAPRRPLASSSPPQGDGPTSRFIQDEHPCPVRQYHHAGAAGGDYPDQSGRQGTEFNGAFCPRNSRRGETPRFFRFRRIMAIRSRLPFVPAGWTRPRSRRLVLFGERRDFRFFGLPSSVDLEGDPPVFSGLSRNGQGKNRPLGGTKPRSVPSVSLSSRNHFHPSVDDPSHPEPSPNQLSGFTRCSPRPAVPSFTSRSPRRSGWSPPSLGARPDRHL